MERRAKQDILKNNWSFIIRQFLINQDINLLYPAIDKLKNELYCNTNIKILKILEAWKIGDFQIWKDIPTLNENLYREGRIEDEVTMTLVYNELIIQDAEAYKTFPLELQGEVFINGIIACKECIKGVKRIGDNFCVASYLVRLGIGLFSAGRFMEATKDFEEAISIWKLLDKLENKKYRLNVATTLHHLGNTLSMCNEWMKAISAFMESLNILKKLNQDCPNQYNLELAQVLNEIGRFYMFRKQLEKALAMFEESRLIYEYILSLEGKGRFLSIESDPRYFNNTLEMSTVYYNIGFSLSSLKRGSSDLEKATKYFEKTISMRKKLLSVSPGIINIKLANVYSSLGGTFHYLYILDKEEQFEEARVNLIKAKDNLEDALKIQKIFVSDKIPIDISDKVITLIRLGYLYIELKDLSKAEKFIIEAIEISKRHNLFLFLANAYEALRDIRLWNTENPLEGFNIAEKAVQSLEKGLNNLSLEERANFSLFKGQIEISYGVCVAHYSQNKYRDEEKVFNLLESQRSIDILANLSIRQTNDLYKKLDIFKAQNIAKQYDFAYLAIEIVPQGAVFFSIEPSGRVEMTKIGMGWRSSFSELYQIVNEHIKEISENKNVELLSAKSSNVINSLKDFGKKLFDLLPKEVQSLFLSDKIRYLFLSPYGETQNFPFELLYLPTGEWLGQKRLLPRVHSFVELESILKRQPNCEIKKGIVLGDSINDLPGARQSAIDVSTMFKSRKFKLVPNEKPLLGNEITEEKFINGLSSGVIICYYTGHGGSDNLGKFLIFPNNKRIRPFDLDNLCLANNPIIYFDCCNLGEEQYSFGGEFSGLSYFTLKAGASCCLQSNRLLFDKISTKVANTFFDNLINKGKTAGIALLEARKSTACSYNNPLTWAFPWLYGNPDAKLI